MDKEKVFTELESLCLSVLGIPDGETVPESAEQVRSSREESFQRLVDLAPQSMVVIAEGGDILFANQQAAELFGEQSSDAIVAKWMGDVVHPDCRADFNDHIAALFHEEGKTWKAEYRFISREGETLYVEVSAIGLRFRGQPAMQLMIHDITERKRVEESYRRSDRNLRELIDGISSALLAVTESGEIIMINAAARACLEIHEDPVGSQLVDLVPEAASLLNDAAPEERRQLVISLPGGTTKILGYMSLTGKNQDFRIVVFRDVTNIVKSEYEKRREEDLALVGDMVRVFTSRKPTWDKAPEDYHSEKMRFTLTQALQTASTDSMVLLQGESGSGKDYLARFIHAHSTRAEGPYFDINCAALPPKLAESELFGHEQGAFTDATRQKRGLLELAENGTLLLNEVGELSVPLQAKLLSFLDNRSFTRVGGTKQITVNARLIAATNRDLEEEVSAGRFRQDLFYRLNVLTVTVPPLRERIEDLPVIAQEILAQLARELNLSAVPEVDPQAMNALAQYHWPGNIRELRNVLERALILAKDNYLRANDLGLKVDETAWSFTLAGFPKDRTLNEVTKDLKRALVTEALRLSRGSRKDAAKSLGISRNSLLHYMKTLHIDA